MIGTNMLHTPVVICAAARAGFLLSVVLAATPLGAAPPAGQATPAPAAAS